MGSTSAASPGGASRLSTFTILGFASAAIPAAALGLVLGVYMPRFFASHLGIGLLAVGGAVASVRLIDMFFDPVIGWAMDRTRTRFGRYRLWYVAGIPIMMVAVYMLFNPPAGVGVPYLMLWLLVMYAGISISTLAHSAWAANIATNYHERSRVIGWMQAVGVFGAVCLLLTPLLSHGAIDPSKGSSMRILGWIIIGVMPLTTLLVLLVTPERIAAVEEKEKFAGREYWHMISQPTMLRLILADLLLTLGPGTTAPLYIFFFHDAKGFAPSIVSLLLIPYIGAGIVGAPVWARVARKFSKHRTLQIASICYAIAQTALMAIPKGLLAPTAVGMFAVGFCASAFPLMVRSMVADYADEVKLEQGKERIGLLYSMVVITQKVGSSITVSIVFPILAFVGYDAAEGAINTERAITGLEMCYLFAPIALVLVGAALFFGYKLDDKRHGEIRAALDKREFELAEQNLEPLSGASPTPAASTTL